MKAVRAPRHGDVLHVARVAALVVALACCACVSAPTMVSAAELPSSSAATEVRSVQQAYILGDSLTWLGRAYLPKALDAWGWRSNPGEDSRSGRMVEEGLAILAKERNLPDTVLIALGTNNWLDGAGDARRWIAQARAIIGPSRTLIWVNIEMVGDRFWSHERINAGLLRGAREDGNTVIADWHSYVRDFAVPLKSDGIHYTLSGSRERMRFYARVLAGDPAIADYLLS